MKVHFWRGEAGDKVVKWAYAADADPVEAGHYVMDIDAFSAAEMPAVWAAKRLWDDATSQPRLPAASEELQRARAAQEAKVRDAANAESGAQVRAFEARIVAAKWGRQAAMNADETAIFNSELTRYNRLVSLVTQIRAATIDTVNTINW